MKKVKIYESKDGGKTYSVRESNIDEIKKEIMKQTSVDYIFEQLEDDSLFFRGTDNELNISISASDYLDLKRLAKEMNKNEILQSHIDGQKNEGFRSYEYEANKYYEENYERSGVATSTSKD